MRKLRALAAFLVPVWALAIIVGPTTAARADFPGTNGRLVFQHNGDLYSALPSGAGLERLTTTGGATPRWSADGKQIVFVRSGAVWIMAADGSHQRKITTGWGPALSPDGKQLAFIRTLVNPPGKNMCKPTSVYGNEIVQHLMVLSLVNATTTRTLKTLTYCPAGDFNDYLTSGVRWTPNGSSLVVAEDYLSNSYWAASIDRINVTTGHLTAAVTLQCEETPYVCPDPNYDPFGNLQPDVSPNGRQLVFVSDEHKRGNVQLYETSPAGKVSFIGGDSNVAGPVWSPDGSEFAYTQRLPGQQPRIRVMNATAGAQPTTVIPDADEVDWQP